MFSLGTANENGHVHSSDVNEITPNHVILNTVVEKAKLSDQMDDIFYRQFFQQIQINNNRK